MDDNALLKSDFTIQLTDIVATIINERPADGLELFESLAVFNKTGKMIPDPDTSVYLGDDIASKTLITPEQLTDVTWGVQYNEQVIPKVVKKKPTGEEEDAPPEEEAPPEDRGELTDITEEHLVFNMLGIGLGESEAYRLMVSMKRLLDQQPLKSARLFGRIFTLSNYYYIAETEIDPDRQPESDDAAPADDEEASGKPPSTILNILQNGKSREEPQLPTEPAGQPGANKYKYYVTTDFCSWRALPDVKPCHIQAARLIKKVCQCSFSFLLVKINFLKGNNKNYKRTKTAIYGQPVCTNSVPPTISGFRSRVLAGSNSKDFIRMQSMSYFIKKKLMNYLPS